MDYFDELSALFESEDADMFKPKPKKHVATPDDRLINTFNDITQFVRDNGRKPDAEADDMREAILGTQLNSIRSDKHRVETLEIYDELGILELDKAPESLDELFSDNTGLFADNSDLFNLSKLPEDKRVVENYDGAAKREPVKDFDAKYKYMFDSQQSNLAFGKLKLTPFRTINQLLPESFYVYDGMMCYVTTFGDKEQKAGGYSQQRIHVVFENGTQSNMYRRSLAQRLYEGGSVVVNNSYTELINDIEAVGRIYILSSLSSDPKVTTIKNLHKIGVTTGTVENRIKNAESDPTYLMAPVKVIESYRLTGDYNPQKVEDLIHQVFGHAKVDLQITASDGKPYAPQEWYSVPLGAILEAVELISSGEILDYHYDSTEQKMVSN